MILFIDDESRLIDSHRRHLEFKLADYQKELVYFSDVDEAMQFFEGHKGELDLAVLDVMMPPGKSFSKDESNHGLKTGYLIYRYFRAALPSLPILLYTNSADEMLVQIAKEDVHLKYLAKTNYALLDDLWSEVRQTLSL